MHSRRFSTATRGANSRLWRSVKHEEVYLKDYADGWEAEESLRRYFEFYCEQRIHQSLDYRTPAEVYGVKDSSC
ncbi:MAG: integrase core domain-containing protein [Planctomycetaceae bacterium]